MSFVEIKFIMGTKHCLLNRAPLCSSLAWNFCFSENSLDWRLPPLTRWLSLSFLRMLFYFCCFWVCRSYLPKCSVLPSKGTNILAVRTMNSVLYLLMTLIINALPMIGIIFVVRWITLLLELEIINVLFKIENDKMFDSWLKPSRLWGVWLR